MLHEAYYLENELTQKLNELFKGEHNFRVEFDLKGFNIYLTNDNPVTDKQFITKRIRELLGVPPLTVGDNRFFTDYHKLTFRVDWDEIFQIK